MNAMSKQLFEIGAVAHNPAALSQLSQRDGLYYSAHEIRIVANGLLETARQLEEEADQLGSTNRIAAF